MSRLGLRIQGKAVSNNVFTPFVEANWLYSSAKNQLTFNDQQFKDGLARNRFEGKMGLQGYLTDNLSVSTSLGGQWGAHGYNQYQGQLQMDYVF